MKIFDLKPLDFMKLSNSLEMQNDASMHREDLRVTHVIRLKPRDELYIYIVLIFLVYSSENNMYRPMLAKCWPMSA